MGYIYKITNLVNSKIYIGKTVNSIESRWRDHVSDAMNKNLDNSLLHKAIRKYGEKNFLCEVLEECEDFLLNEKEIYYIDLYDSFFLSDRGYNLTHGGEGATKYSDKEILSLWNRDLRNCEISKILKANENTISSRIKQLVGPTEAQRRRGESRKIKILQYDLYGNFIECWNSAAEAEKTLNLSTGSITKCCKKERTYAGASLWKYFEDATPIIDFMTRYAMSPKCCAVDLVDDNNTIIKTYNSAREAEEDLNLTRGKVSAVCNHEYGRKTAGGKKFQWNYKIKRELIENGIK